MKTPVLTLGLLASAALLVPFAAEARLDLRPLVATAQVASPRAALLTGAERTQVLTSASQALNRVRSIQGRFTQRNADGSIQTGQFWLQRPGRMRFEYDRPSPLLLVADGTTLAIEHRDLRNTDRLPLRQSPLHFVLKNDINLERDARVTQVERRGDLTRVSVADRRGEVSGTLTLVLRGPAYDLIEWVVVDGDGARAQVSLTEVRAAANLPASLFRIVDANDPTARRRP